MVLSYAWAAALQQAVVCIGRLLVQGMLTPLGTNTVTGYNMSLRIEQFLFCFSQGVSAAMVVCLSQNLGHGDRVRVRRFYRVSVCVEGRADRRAWHGVLFVPVADRRPFLGQRRGHCRRCALYGYDGISVSLSPTWARSFRASSADSGGCG